MHLVGNLLRKINMFHQAKQYHLVYNVRFHGLLLVQARQAQLLEPCWWCLGVEITLLISFLFYLSCKIQIIVFLFIIKIILDTFIVSKI